MTITTGYKRALLRHDYAQSIASGRTLLDQLTLALSELVDSTGDGLVVSSTESDGSRVAFSSPRSAGMSPSDMTEVRGEFIDLYDRALDALGGSAGDAEIFTRMLLFLQPVKRVRATFQSLEK